MHIQQLEGLAHKTVLHSIITTHTLTELMLLCINFVDVTVGFGSPGVSVQESSGQFMMCVVRDSEALQDITVTISSEDGTAISNVGVYNLQLLN